MRQINKNRSYLILIIMSVLVSSYSENIFAGRGGGYSGAPAMKKLPPLITPKPSPPLFIQYKWTPNDVINIFITNGLEAQDVKPLTAEDYSSLPAKAKDARKFIIPSEHEVIQRFDSLIFTLC